MIFLILDMKLFFFRKSFLTAPGLSPDLADLMALYAEANATPEVGSSAASTIQALITSMRWFMTIRIFSTH